MLFSTSLLTMPLTYLISPPLYSEHLNLVTHKQVRKERKKEKKKRKKLSPPLLSVIQAPPLNSETTTGRVQLSVSRFPSLSSSPLPQSVYTRLGNLHEERAHMVCSLLISLFLSRLLVLFFRLLCNVKLKSALAH